MTFQNKLAYGQLWEDKAKEFITKHNEVEVTEEQTSVNYRTMHYDFKTSDDITYEVKADTMSSKTGNFFIEYHGYGKPSGISIATAHTHILTDERICFKIPTKKIIRLIKRNDYKEGFVKSSNTKGVLIPRADIIKYACVYDCF